MRRYGQNDVLPPRCPVGEFCPDEEDHCRPLLPFGGACQLNRDGTSSIPVQSKRHVKLTDSYNEQINALRPSMEACGPMKTTLMGLYALAILACMLIKWKVK